MSIATQEHLGTRDKMHLWGAFHRRRFLGSVAEPIGIQKCEGGENIEISLGFRKARNGIHGQYFTVNISHYSISNFDGGGGGGAPFN